MRSAFSMLPWKHERDKIPTLCDTGPLCDWKVKPFIVYILPRWSVSAMIPSVIQDIAVHTRGTDLALTFPGHRQCLHGWAPVPWPFPCSLVASAHRQGRHISAKNHNTLCNHYQLPHSRYFTMINNDLLFTKHNDLLFTKRSQHA